MTMTTTPAVASPLASWRPVDTGDTTVAVAQRHALGTTARLAVWPPETAGPAMTAVDEVLSSLDLQASRFRPDSEISWVHRAHDGLYMLSDGLAEAVRVALAAAAWTGGLADPTVGAALIALGYDRDFAALDPDRREPAPGPVPAPGWQSARLAGPPRGLPRPRDCSGCGATARCCTCPPGCCSTWGPRPRAWARTVRPVRSRPPPG